MKKWIVLCMTALLCGCGVGREATGQAGATAMDVTSEASGAGQTQPAAAPQDSIVTYDTVRAGAWASGYWAELKTVDYTTYDADLAVDIRASAYMFVKAYHHERVLFRKRVRGRDGMYWGPCWLTAVADDGRLWILNCTENSLGVGAASPVETFCLDGRGIVLEGLAPPFDPYTQSALLQLDGSRLLHGGAVLDMKAREWSNLNGTQGAGYCSDTLNGHVLLVMDKSASKGDVALFYTLPDLRLRLSFPCACHGPSGSTDEAIFSYGFNANGQYVLEGSGERQYKVDLSTWTVDSTGAH